MSMHAEMIGCLAFTYEVIQLEDDNGNFLLLYRSKWFSFQQYITTMPVCFSSYVASGSVLRLQLPWTPTL